jgi:hypothetical protein
MEQAHELLGERICGEVPVGRLATEERIAERPAHDVPGVSGVMEPVEELDHDRRDEISKACLVSGDGHGSR